ncbi:Protein root UVB sensitive 4 [Ranunculus cassubicifolius]
MQSTSYIPTDSYHLPWQKFSLKPIPHKPQTLALNPSYQEIKNQENSFHLPIKIKNQDSGKVSQYFWDGIQLSLVPLDDGDGVNLFSLDDGFGKLYKGCRNGVRNFLLPNKVQENYVQYVKWKFFHRVFSSALQVLATQAMFRAMGVGFSRSLPSAAALNWVLKDGLGKLSRCIYSACLASAFDSKLKRVRFSTSIVFSLSIGVELLTPFFPRYFLLLATVANIAKQISLACYLSTRTAVHRSFAVAGNICEISAKAQIQTVCFDTLGLTLAAVLNLLCKKNHRLQVCLPLVLYPIFSAFDLLGIYQGLKHVHLPTLTKDRLEIITDTWIQSECVPSPSKVSKEEGIGFSWFKDD